MKIKLSSRRNTVLWCWFTYLFNVSLFRVRTNVHYLIYHLTLADSITCFITLPMETIWRVTIQVRFNNTQCWQCWVCELNKQASGLTFSLVTFGLGNNSVANTGFVSFLRRFFRRPNNEPKYSIYSIVVEREATKSKKRR